MQQAIGAYRQVTATDEFRELERARHFAMTNRASALAGAEEKGYKRAEEKWQGVVAEKDAEIARLRALVGEGN